MTRDPLPLGHVVTTPAAHRLLLGFGDSNYDLELLRRHKHHDWGDLCAEDRGCNEQALKDGGKIMSEYRVGASTVWIHTEGDRSVTTILLPEEY